MGLFSGVGGRLLAAVLIVVVQFQASEVRAEDALKIGVIVPLTGSTASSGITVRNGIELASSQFDPDRRVHFVFEDDQFQPSNSLSSAKKLIERDRVKGLIVFGSPTSLAVSPIAEHFEIPMVALSVVRKVVEGKRYVMKHWVKAEIENVRVVEEVMNRGYKSIAIVATSNDAMIRLRDLFVSDYRGKVSQVEEVAKDESDFRTIITKIVKARPDAIYNLLWAPQPGLFSRGLRAAGYQGSIFGVHNLEDLNEIKNSAGGLDRGWFVTGDDSNGGRFYSAYESRFHSKPSAGGINAFDIAKMFIQWSGEGDLNEYLHHLREFDGAYGRYHATNENDFDINSCVKEIEGENISPCLVRKIK